MAKKKPQPQAGDDPVVEETPEVETPQVLPDVPNTIEGEPPAQSVRRSGTEAPEPVKKAPAKPEDFEFNFDCGKLNRDVLYRIIFALVLGQTHSYVGQGAVRRVGELFGAATHQEAIEIWRKIKRHHTKGN